MVAGAKGVADLVLCTPVTPIITRLMDAKAAVVIATFVPHAAPKAIFLTHAPPRRQPGAKAGTNAPFQHCIKGDGHPYFGT